LIYGPDEGASRAPASSSPVQAITANPANSRHLASLGNFPRNLCESEQANSVLDNFLVGSLFMELLLQKSD
jgi:hypothetical protein